jgi:hypothetical protein
VQQGRLSVVQRQQQLPKIAVRLCKLGIQLKRMAKVRKSLLPFAAILQGDPQPVVRFGSIRLQLQSQPKLFRSDGRLSLAQQDQSQFIAKVGRIGPDPKCLAVTALRMVEPSQCLIGFAEVRMDDRQLGAQCRGTFEQFHRSLGLSLLYEDHPVTMQRIDTRGFANEYVPVKSGRLIEQTVPLQDQGHL